MLAVKLSYEIRSECGLIIDPGTQNALKRPFRLFLSIKIACYPVTTVRRSY